MSLQVDIEAGDIILFSRPCTSMPPLAGAICVGAKISSLTEYDHLGLVLENPKTHELLIVEANMQGITMYPLVDRLKRTRAKQVAIRKLHRSETEDTTNNNFIQHLWDTVQKYANAQYNASLLDMSAAVMASYTQHRSSYAALQQRLFTLHHEINYMTSYLDHVRQSSLESDAAASTLLERCLRLRCQELEQEQKSAQNVFNMLAFRREVHRPASSSSVPPSGTSPGASEFTKHPSYFCSQLVAQVFLDLGILHPAHRDANEYLPADFSSSTNLQGLIPNVPPLSTTKQAQKYSLSPDIVVQDPQSLVFLDVDSSLSTLKSDPFIPSPNTSSSTSSPAEPSKPAKLTVLVPAASLPPPNVAQRLVESVRNFVDKNPTTAPSTLSPDLIAVEPTVVPLYLHPGDTIRGDIWHKYLTLHGDLNAQTDDVSKPRLVDIVLEGEILLRSIVVPEITSKESQIAGLTASISSDKEAKVVPSRHPLLITSSDLSVSTAAPKSHDDKSVIRTKMEDIIRTNVATRDHDPAEILPLLRAYHHLIKADNNLPQQQSLDQQASPDPRQLYDYEIVALKSSRLLLHFQPPSLAKQEHQLSSSASTWGNDDVPSHSHVSTAPDHDNSTKDLQATRDRDLLRRQKVQSLIALAWPVYQRQLVLEQQQHSAQRLGSFSDVLHARTAAGSSETPSELIPDVRAGSRSILQVVSDARTVLQQLSSYLPTPTTDASTDSSNTSVIAAVTSVSARTSTSMNSKAQEDADRLLFTFACHWDEALNRLLLSMQESNSNKDKNVSNRHRTFRSAAGSGNRNKSEVDDEVHRIAVHLAHVVQYLCDPTLPRTRKSNSNSGITRNPWYETPHADEPTTLHSNSSGDLAHGSHQLSEEAWQMYRQRRLVLIERIEALLHQEYIPSLLRDSEQAQHHRQTFASTEIKRMGYFYTLGDLLSTTGLHGTRMHQDEHDKERQSWMNSLLSVIPLIFVSTSLVTSHAGNQKHNVYSSPRSDAHHNPHATANTSAVSSTASTISSQATPMMSYHLYRSVRPVSHRLSSEMSRMQRWVRRVLALR